MKGNALMNRPVPSCTSILKILFQCTAVYCVLCTVYCVLCTDQTCSHVLVFNRILATSPFEPWTQVPPICSDFVHCIGMVSGTGPNLFRLSTSGMSFWITLTGNRFQGLSWALVSRNKITKFILYFGD